ncbi:MAG: AAA family ATPase [Planctomycetota bacterium]
MMGTGTAAEISEYRGRIFKVFYASPSYSAGKMKTTTGETVTFAGKFYAREKDHLVLHGGWNDHPKYGIQFNVESVSYDQLLDAEGLAHFLSNHPEIKGVGPVRAERIASHFGTDFDQVITESPERITGELKIPEDIVQQIRDVWIQNRKFNQTNTHLAAYGLTHYQVSESIKKYGNNAQSIVKGNPYMLIREISGFGFRRVDLIALKMRVRKDDANRVRAGVRYCVDQALDRGDCWVERERLIDEANDCLAMDVLNSREIIDRSLDDLVRDGKLSSIGCKDRRLIARPEVWRYEKYIARTLLRAATRGNRYFEGRGEEELESMILDEEPLLYPGQLRAVLSALKHSVSIISGGAGSGKTYAVAALTKIMKSHHLKVALAAPTGKAAKRMEEVVGHPASTLHRLLRYNGQMFRKNEDDPIDADVVIVDEVSMVDVFLAYRLLKAIDFTRTTLILVGDHNQLPPVGPGNLLLDLIRTKSVPMVLLDEVIRQAGILKENSIAILKGEVRPTPEGGEGVRKPWYVVDHYKNPGDVRRFLLELMDQVVGERLSFDLINDIQVLTPTHRGELGTHELNIALQRLIQKKLWGVDVAVTPPGRKPRFYVHDKVIQTRNNYDLQVMNGAQGVVEKRGDDGSLAINFDGHTIHIEAGSAKFRDLQLAYALSIHKSQGSEYPCAIVIIHKSHSFMHHRNLFYTGITRAKETAIILGDRWGMKNCAATQRNDRRNTFLGFLLASLIPGDVKRSGEEGE